MDEIHIKIRDEEMAILVKKKGKRCWKEFILPALGIKFIPGLKPLKKPKKK